MRILLVGGGSGGHVYPVIAIANALKEKSAKVGGAELMLLGDDRLMRQAAQENGIKFHSILSGKLRRYFSILNLLDIFKFPVGFIQSLWYIYWFMPDVVFAKGGYVSVIPSLIAKLYFIPLYIHDSDAVPGLANRFLGKLADKIFISFQISIAYFNASKTILIGNPVRKELLNGNKNEAVKLFNFSADKKTVFVYGGSQGSRSINNIILESLVIMVGKDLQIIHQCGKNQYDIVKSEVDKIIKEGEGSYADSITQNYKLFSFLNVGQLSAAYALCDVVVSRAGAGSIAEIAILGKPAIFIPLSTKSSRGEQIANAVELSKHGAVMIEEENLTPHIVMSQIEYLLKPENYEEISQKIKSFAMPDAADKIAEAILSGKK
ncbi:MAG: hypothetical protein A3J46_02545 [Candidatus Yanofskybacteria bacterium RIFCSPHIGHO2_02_FULL_41_11]|uniref:UDP-N-acetylglucosamine--N-acetylmuramyl-(pentapeptide) pyrophosphoryl-undecaprenol N-acetylglucosamine transferase n=1 Tax=Candidatus Yanofskybacteria bacterium RIFCSPHIGHO2_02_FULL_41_11 TaxID=1802675 RepID=A0A1F8F709_9BACT|nr:MAG: hypothetical protein A3J46_02545 [Candidatus Yanofskybacteria bacterium RIFCSPHIGHO2_02_FULL_41_11]